MIDELVSSILYTEIDGLINRQNKHLNTFLIETIIKAGDYTHLLREFWIKDMEARILKKKSAYFLYAI